MGTRVSSRQLVGRDQALGLLTELMQRAADGNGGTALVVGEAGIGKSRLLSEFSRRAGEQGVLVLTGDCVDLAEVELPYAPIVGALRGVVRGRNEAELARLFGGARAELARLLPELGDADPALPGSLGQARLFELILGVLSRLSQERPVALAVEDVHWADSASLDLLAFLVRNQRTERLAMIVTYRSDELAAEHPAHTRVLELSRSGRAQRIELEPLTTDQLAEQVLGITGTRPGVALSRALHDRSQGNPLFTEELLAGGGDDELPASLRDALLVRVRRLSERGREIVGVAAVVGRPVDHRLLAALEMMSNAELIAALRDAVAHHVLISDGLSYTFRHALLREAVYDDLVASQRVPLHAAVAAVLTGRPELAGDSTGLAAEIAHHWSAAGAREPALAASVQAGADAERVYAIQEARWHYERVLWLWDRVTDPERLTGVPLSSVLTRAADAEWLAGDEAEAVALARLALEQPDLGSDDARAALLEERLANYLWAEGDSDGALRAARRAVDRSTRAGAPADRARALCAEGRMLVMRSRNREALSGLEEALALTQDPDARSEEGPIRNYLGSALAFLGDYPHAIAHLRASVRIARDTGAQARGLSHYENLSEVLAEVGQFDAARDVAAEGIAAARESGLQRSYGLVVMGRAALCALALGGTAEAGELTAAALELGEKTFFAFNVLEARARYELVRGDLDASERHLSAAEAMASRSRDVMWAGPIGAVRAELELCRGRPEAVPEIVQATLSLAPERECLQHTAELHWLGARALADLTLGAAGRQDSDAQGQATALLARLDERLASSFPLGTAPARVQADAALCGAEVARARHDADLIRWSAAVSAADACGHIGRSTYARWRHAEALLEHGERQQAKVKLSDAARIAAASEHTPLTREIQALAQRARVPLGAPDATVATTHKLGLTPRELEVLGLIADGLTNRQIAGSLYISEKTAEHHVSHILSKLGVPTRAAAGSVAHRAGIRQAGSTAST